jgi:hypothetical protein
MKQGALSLLRVTVGMTRKGACCVHRAWDFLGLSKALPLTLAPLVDLLLASIAGGLCRVPDGPWVPKLLRLFAPLLQTSVLTYFLPVLPQPPSHPIPNIRILPVSE